MEKIGVSVANLAPMVVSYAPGPQSETMPTRFDSINFRKSSTEKRTSRPKRTTGISPFFLYSHRVLTEIPSIFAAWVSSTANGVRTIGKPVSFMLSLLPWIASRLLIGETLQPCDLLTAPCLRPCSGSANLRTLQECLGLVCFVIPLTDVRRVAA